MHQVSLTEGAFLEVNSEALSNLKRTSQLLGVNLGRLRRSGRVRRLEDRQVTGAGD